ncbi:MAG: SDR family NAD(P)-dependent oxidoreductase [Bacteroidetes bacterium]|nr:SDR family NAD(P)-dependent oxidoreductase [Bacteroidota bacterium]MBS1974959.1 SDR family NAD(P)-dependent oxidoreductase [Bacteroidota bacterium]
MKKTAIITGASGNLGCAVARKFIDEGYHVIGLVHKKSSLPESIVKDVQSVELDLRNEEICREAVDAIIQQSGTIDVAVLTAGGFAMGGIADTTTPGVHAQYQLNFETAYNIARPVFLQMLQQNKGRIFFIGSKAGHDATKAIGVTAYALAKSLLFRLAELINAEADGKNVVAAVVVPGIIDTPQNRAAMPDADFSRWVSTSQIADVICFYSSEKASPLREPVIKVYNRS